MSYLDELINTLGKLGPEAFCVVGCIAFGYAVKLVPYIPNKHIPWMCIASGPAIYPFLTDFSRVSPDSQQPIVRIVMTGLILGVVAWLIHNAVIWRLEQWLKVKLQAASSKRYRKGKDGAFEEVTDGVDETKPP